MLFLTDALDPFGIAFGIAFPPARDYGRDRTRRAIGTDYIHSDSQ